ncbi:MAG: S1C family serine protease, partial [Planctomycetota bacterium]
FGTPPTYDPFLGQPARPVAVGSGVLIERKGRLWVVTNVHVVQGADAIDVITVDGRTHPCEVHDTITLYDIALLSFVDRPRGLRPVKIGPRASRNIQVGAWVLATGNPFSLAMDGQPVVTLGVLSGKDRILGGQYFYGNALQHDAPVNPGNSGGPLWDLRGNLVGINGKIASWSRFRGARPSNTGASYSLPIYQVSEFLTALIDRRTDARAGYLGIEVETQTDDRGYAVGARVKTVHEKSPAAASRTALKKGDLVTSVFFMQTWHRIRTESDLTNLLALGSVGDFLKVKYRRGRNSYSWQGRLTGGP